MKDEPGHTLVSGTDIHGEGRRQARRMETRSSARRRIDISRQGVLSYEERDMRQNLKDEDRGRKQPVAEKGGSQTRPKWAKMDGFGSKARPNLTVLRLAFFNVFLLARPTAILHMW